jgi:hypothetical protein
VRDSAAILGSERAANIALHVGTDGTRKEVVINFYLFNDADSSSGYQAS